MNVGPPPVCYLKIAPLSDKQICSSPISWLVFIPQASATYVTMKPGVRMDPDIRCSCPDCAELSDFPPPPSDLCSSPESKQRDSIISQGLSEYVEVDTPRRICQYQNLDLSQVEEHVYHGLHVKSVQVVKEQL